MPGPLAGLRVLDLTRILAGPTCTQLLADLGADVIKVERPGQGDDTRRWGPPFAQDKDGRDTTESAYYLSANRNKRSLTLDLAVTEGRDLVRRLIAKSDVLVENFKVGDLARHNLDYRSLAPEFPRLIYCSITGFGQTGPYAPQAGYDYLAQAMGGLMSITGESDGAPAKVGVGIADIMTGMYACSAILAALHHREQTGRGQYIDMALLDCQVAMLSYAGQYFLTSGKSPERPGNGHPTIVPYHTFATTDGWMVLAVGNDSQFRKFCDFAGRSELAEDDRFRTNALRVRNRAALMEILNRVMAMRTTKAWVDGLTTLGVPSGPINTIDETFADTQVRHRGMAVEMNHPLTPGPLALIGNPIKMSETPPTYRHAPPVLGQHTNEVLSEVLGLSEARVSELRQKGVV